jgi:hypothetical protein
MWRHHRSDRSDRQCRADIRRFTFRVRSDCRRRRDDGDVHRQRYRAGPAGFRNRRVLSNSGGATVSPKLRTAPSGGCLPTQCQNFVHVYYAAGSKSIALIVADSQGRQSSAASTTTVVTLSGTWRNTLAPNPATGLPETRALTLTQSGGILTGTYTHPAGNVDALHGTAAQNSASGTLTISLRLENQTIVMIGSSLDIDGLIDDGNSLRLRVTGGSADGQKLTFLR